MVRRNCILIDRGESSHTAVIYAFVRDLLSFGFLRGIDHRHSPPWNWEVHARTRLCVCLEPRACALLCMKGERDYFVWMCRRC